MRGDWSQFVVWVNCQKSRDFEYLWNQWQNMKVYLPTPKLIKESQNEKRNDDAIRLKSRNDESI